MEHCVLKVMLQDEPRAGHAERVEQARARATLGVTEHRWKFGVG